MSKKELVNLILESNTMMPINQIVIGMLAAVILSMIMYFIYKKTYSGVLYSKNFNISLFLVAVILCATMMVIGSNLAMSLGLVGSLSIIRFRTAVKDPKDIACLFWAIIIGLSCGTGFYLVGLIVTIFISLILFVSSKGIYDNDSYLVVLNANKNLQLEKAEEIIRSYTKRNNLKMKTITDEYIDITWEVKMTSNNDNELVKELRSLKEVKTINIISYTGEISG